MNTNIILNTDSYKASHYLQYPPKTEIVFSYVESRGGEYPYTIFFGLQAFLKEYLTKPITQEMIDEAEAFWKVHGEPFNKEGWQYILNTHNGYLPLRIKAVPEGAAVPNLNALVTIENTDPHCYWLTSYVETSMLRAIWYPTTVATVSHSIKQIIKKYLEQTADPEALGGLPFKLHDFGARGVSSFESAGIGGAAHLVNFMGTDTVSGILFAQKYYNQKDMVAFSVPAAEHSSITSWGRENETAAYRNMFEQFGGKFPIISVVSDSYDIYHAVGKMWGEELKDLVINSGSTLVVRPDSGKPAEVVVKVAEILDAKFGHTVNSKGYRVLNNVRIIQGDGIDEGSIKDILANLVGAGYSSDNLVFGMGGALLQHSNRDTQKFAYKASAARINGEWIDVFKDPITDTIKKSKRGRLMLYFDNIHGYYTAQEGGDGDHSWEMLQTVYLNGKITKEYTFTEIRRNSEEGF